MHKAGWIFNLDSEESLKRYIHDGVYATKIKPPSQNFWHTAYTGTFADFVSMKEGELIYFFIKKKIYGIGELVNIEGTNACVFDNFKGASLPLKYEEFLPPKSDNYYEDNLLYYEKGIWDVHVDDGDKRYFQQRWLCTFKPSPCFYEGVDMDELLKRDKSHKDMRGLRTFEGLTFVKLSPAENRIFQEHLDEHKLCNFTEASHWKDAHKKIAKKYNNDFKVGLDSLLKYRATSKGQVQSEMLLEAYIIHHMARKTDKTISAIFGNWDYFSHQVTASPFKPRRWMDTMDIFGYQGSEGIWKADKYLLVEIKKDKAGIAELKQIQKYIEWLKWEYGAREENIKSFLVAHKFDDIEWPGNISLIKYQAGESIVFERV